MEREKIKSILNSITIPQESRCLIICRENIDTVRGQFFSGKNVEIAHLDNAFFPRWINEFDLIISLGDLRDLENPRQVIRNISMIARKSASFVIVCKDEKSDNAVSELLYSEFMIISRTTEKDAYIIKSIKLPKRR